MSTVSDKPRLETQIAEFKLGQWVRSRMARTPAVGMVVQLRSDGIWPRARVQYKAEAQWSPWTRLVYLRPATEEEVAQHQGAKTP